MNLTILPEAALDDAKNIDSIVSQIGEDLEALNRVIKNNIPEHLETEWSVRLLNDWEEYYNGNVKDAMMGMTMSATNLKNAVDMALNYSKN